MTIPTSTRWFNLRHETQRADGSLNRLRAIQDGARRGQQRARNRNNIGGARRRDCGVLARPRDRASAAMKDEIVARVSRTLSAKSCGRNWLDNRQDSDRPT